jgi:hypothetical protein
VTFAPGETQKTVTLDTNNDSLDEADETVILKVDSVSQGAIANPTAFGTGTIIDNDPTPTFSINDRMVNEADGTITFTVSLSAPSGQATSVNYMVNPGTAQTGDYTGTTSGTLNFAAGDTSKTITLTIVNDSLTEATETFSVVLSNPVNATLQDGTGIGTIVDNDSVAPTINAPATN